MSKKQDLDEFQAENIEYYVEKIDLILRNIKGRKTLKLLLSLFYKELLRGF